MMMSSSVSDPWSTQAQAVSKPSSAAAAAAATPAPQVVTRMSVTLSSDARAVDAEVAARFLSAFQQYIESPARLL